MSAERNVTETIDYSPWFSAKNNVKAIKIPCKCVSQGERNDTNFNFIASSSE